MKRLLTPVLGLTYSLGGFALTGGRDYVLVSENDSFVNNLVAREKLTPLVNDKGAPIKLPDSANQEDLRAIYTEKADSSPWNPEEEAYEDYVANTYRFAMEAYAAELEANEEKEGEGEGTEKPLTAAQKRALAAKEAAAAAAENKPAE